MGEEIQHAEATAQYHVRARYPNVDLGRGDAFQYIVNWRSQTMNWRSEVHRKRRLTGRLCLEGLACTTTWMPEVELILSILYKPHRRSNGMDPQDANGEAQQGSTRHDGAIS